MRISKNRNRSFLVIFVVDFFVLFLCASISYSEDIWRCGTIAPQGSDYEKIIKKISSEIEKKFNIKIKVYYSTFFTDEIDIARDMRNGKLDCAILTGNGLGYLSKYAMVLQLPFLIKSKDEWRKVQKGISNLLTKAVRDDGWEILTLFGIGFVHFLSKYKLEEIQDFSDRRFWVWPTNPVQVEVFKVLENFGVKPFEVSVIDLLNFCDKTDIIWGPPYALVAFGWYRHFKYIVFPPILYFPGGVVVSLQKLQTYSTEVVSQLKEVFGRESDNITQELEILNEKAYETIFRSGIKKVEMKSVEKFEEVFKSQIYPSFKKHVPSWLIVSVMEEILKFRKY